MIGCLGIIGAGNMGGAITRGLLESRLLSPDRIVLMDISTSRLEELRNELGVTVTSRLKELAKRSDTVILAVKPQIIPSLLDDLKKLLPPRCLVISIAAGVSLETLTRGLPPAARIVRAMPNTPALHGVGMTALSPGETSTAEDLETARRIFEALGEVVVVEEKQMDAVTGLSGSGPAYVFLFIEALSDGGVRMGLSRETATRLAVQTVLGSAVMALKSGKHPAQLKDMVTSPAGTTISGIHTLERSGFRGIVMSAVESAVERSRELGRT